MKEQYLKTLIKRIFEIIIRTLPSQATPPWQRKVFPFPRAEDDIGNKKLKIAKTTP